MGLSSIVRNKAFWFYDALKGGTIRKNYHEINLHFENYNSKNNISLRRNYLKNILKHTIETVPAYNEISDYKIDSFPIINKNIIKDDFDNFLSKSFDKKKLFKTTTSGSTGTPFVIYKDSAKLLRHKADNIFFSHRAGYLVGSKLMYLRVWNEINKKTKLDQLLLNIRPVEIGNLSTSTIKGLIEQLQNIKEKKSILSFASALEGISKILEDENADGKKDFNIDCIIAMSESLPDGAKKILQDYFCCPVLSRYSNMENGFIAQQEFGSGNNYYINHGSFYIEIFDIHKDVPAPNGVLGRIVITDFFNYSMPFIRYDTGDLGIMIKNEEFDRRGPILSKVEGRKVDFIYNTKNEMISPHTVTNTMWKYSDVKQFQFIQETASTYIMKLNVMETLSSENKLIEDLKRYLGKDASITIEYVNEIPLLNSGKRKKIVNKMIPTN